MRRSLRAHIVYTVIDRHVLPVFERAAFLLLELVSQHFFQSVQHCEYLAPPIFQLNSLFLTGRHFSNGYAARAGGELKEFLLVYRRKWPARITCSRTGGFVNELR